MPEHDKNERLLPGEAIVTTSSDDAIQAVVADLRREIRGLPNPGTIVDVEIYPPKPVTDSTLAGLAPIKSHDPIAVVKLSADSSRFGHSIVNRRQQQLRKAA